jgi:putative salt-induced outer membrane protein YdiY
VRWQGRADLGYNLTQGNANTQLGTFTLFAERKRPEARHFSFLFDAARGRSSGVETANRARVETKLDRATVGESYRYWLLGAGYDRVRDSDLRLEAGSGFGRTLINTASNHLSAEIGASYVRERFTRTGTETDAKLRFGETWERPLSRRVGLSHSLALLSVVGNYRDYTALSVFAVTLQVSQKVSLVSRLTNNYDSRPAPGTKRSDLLLTSQLGFAFGP